MGSLSFVTLALSTLARGAAAPRALLLTALVGLWALRLGSHLVARIRVEGKDRRFDGVRDRPAKFLFFWTIQGVWVFVTSLPCLLVNTALSQPALRWTDALGASCAAITHAHRAACSITVTRGSRNSALVRCFAHLCHGRDICSAQFQGSQLARSCLWRSVPHAPDSP